MAHDVRAGRGGQVASAGVRGAPRARYLPIAEHGLIGDLHTVALVGTDGTIDCYCCPRFDSPSVFAAILDADHGRLFRISPDCDAFTPARCLALLLLVRHCTTDAVAGTHASSRGQAVVVAACSSPALRRPSK